MADLHSQVIVGDNVTTHTVGANTRKVLTSSDNTGPETTWLYVRNAEFTDWEGGETWTAEPELTTSNSTNYQAIVECIQIYCEIYEVVRASSDDLVIKVRWSSVPYAGTEAKNDQAQNSILTAILQAHPELGSDFSVYNGRFTGRTVAYT